MMRHRSEDGPGEAGFDAAFYISAYPDVATSGLSPLEHYRLYGQAEGRYPNELVAVGFDANYYLREYPDVIESGIDPGEHYLTLVRNAGRHPNAMSAGKAAA